MASYSQQMQNLFEQYQRDVSPDPVDLKEVGRWAMEQNLWHPRPVDIQSRFASDMADALREEYRTDNKGRRYRSKLPARTGRKDGHPLFEWGDIDTAPRDHVELSLKQRRKQIVGDCVQLKTDTDHWNDANADQEQIEMPLDFTDDVAEDMVASGIADVG